MCLVARVAGGVILRMLGLRGRGKAGAQEDQAGHRPLQRGELRDSLLNRQPIFALRPRRQGASTAELALVGWDSAAFPTKPCQSAAFRARGCTKLVGNA